MEDIHNISNVNSTLQSKVIDIKATLPIVQVNTGGGGLVNDVLVNGESVVTDRIAYITLPENLEDRLTAIESKYINEIISKINGSVSLSKSVFYAGYPININVVGTLSLPTEVSSNYVSNIMLSGNQTTVSDNGVTQVSINNTNITDNTTFSLSASISSPYTKSISKQATINKVCPIYIAIVDNNVDTVEKAITAIKKDANLYSPETPISNIKTITNKSFTYGANQRLAFICGQSDVKIKQVGALANDAYTAKGSTTINGVTAYVYVSAPQQAITRNMTFNA